MTTDAEGVVHRYNRPDQSVNVVRVHHDQIDKDFDYYAVAMTPVWEHRVYAAECPMRENLFEYYAMLLTKRIGTVAVISDRSEASAGRRQIDYYSDQMPWFEEKYGATLLVSMSMTQRIALTGDEAELLMDDIRESASLNVYSYRLTITLNEAESWMVKVIRLSGWPDMGVITRRQLSLWKENIRQKLKHTPGPLLVHCSAGRGRTGVTLGALYLDERRISDADMLCTRMSGERGFRMPQRHEQKKLLHEYADYKKANPSRQSPPHPAPRQTKKDEQGGRSRRTRCTIL
ncbi:tyrosine-protein phosphatase [Salmonella enterica]